MNPLIVIDGVSVRRDQSGRYCLNDLHRAAGGLSKHQPSNWMRLDSTLGLIDELSRSSNLRNGHPVTNSQYVNSLLNPVNVIRGGAAQGTYVSKELVYAYAMWISASFSLRVIRTFDSVMASADTGHANDLVQAGVTLLGFMQSSLNLSNSSVLGACQKLQAAVGLPDLAPSYAIDAPAGSMDDSSRPTMALSTILKNRGINVRITEAYRRLESLGLVERRSRPSSSARAKNGRREFWCVSHRGLSFGKNITSPNNPRETQPHFYESRVDELLSMMLTASAV